MAGWNGVVWESTGTLSLSRNFFISVGALGNASGTPSDGTQNVSFGEAVAKERRIVNSAAKSAASRNSWFNCMGNRSGMKADSGSESSASYDTASSPNFDLRDPKVLADLLTQPPKPSTHSPTSMQFNEQIVVTEHTSGGAASMTVGNLGGTGKTRPASSLPGGNALRQHANAGGNSNSNAGGNPNSNDNPNGSPNSDNSGGSDSNGNQGSTSGGNDPQDLGNGNQGSTSGGNDPQDSGPNLNDLNKILLEHTTAGGPLQHWGAQGTIRAEELVQFSGVRDPQTYQWVLQCRRHLMQPEIIDRLSDNMSFLYQHNDGNRV